MWLFLGRAAHQLKTPVAALQATLEVLLRRDRTRDELLASLEDLQLGITQMSSLTQMLIRSSRIAFEPALENMSVDLNELLGEQLRLFRPQADRHDVRLTLSLAEQFVAAHKAAGTLTVLDLKRFLGHSYSSRLSS
jgi:signal transduction histidine kinase